MKPRDIDGLEGMLPPVAAWFRASLGTPTPPQRMGWPTIASGQNTLIFAPTGSGKTLAAFLACLDHLWRIPPAARGVRILYISPLKALNNDIARNLEFPLAGILDESARMGTPLVPLNVAVRTGDTPTAQRQRLVRQPPDILITTPESLHLILTSRARETLRTVTHVIVDEIHALCPNKRGVFLALLLERLEALCPGSFVRIGLSATQRPLDEVARYLGGLRPVPDERGSPRYQPRPVAIVDAGQRKDLDLEVSWPGGPNLYMPAGSIWPAIESRLSNLIATHRSTLIFANNRRVVERLTARLNEAAESAGDETDPELEIDLDGPVARRAIAHSHHGSLSLDARRETEESLKRGDLSAVVATASLELGIDMGAIDLVCQVESPGSIARGLQRVGRAGHLVGRSSKGRLIAKTPADLLESAALARAMTSGEVESLRVPTNCLDVLAQQIVACVAVESWDAHDLFQLVRGAYPYRDLTAASFENVLQLVSGRFQVETLRDLRPRISWDRINNRLHALPGSAQHALVGGGAIPDTGNYPLYLGAEGPRLGELDEEFVLERRVGETFVLGTSTWRIESIDPQRVVVSRAEGKSALMPFWRGEATHRTPELGEKVGALCREISDRINDPNLSAWLVSEYHLAPEACTALRGWIARQISLAGAAPDDRTVLIETFTDPAGELGLAVLTPFGGKLHHALKLALQAQLRERLGIAVACLHGDDGLLIRLPQMDEPPFDLFDGLTAERADSLIRDELGESAMFGLRFRQNAGRALLMPRPDPAKRTPLWLQRLRAKDLLQAVRRFPDFPIVLETYRECLTDDLDLPRLRVFLDDIQRGAIRIVTRQGETASPFASELIFQFTQKYLYEWDEPRRGDQPVPNGGVDRAALDPLLTADHAALWLDPDAIGRVDSRLRGDGRPPRTTAEMAERLRHNGDLTADELVGPMRAQVDQIVASGLAQLIELPGTFVPSRWIHAEEAELYANAFADPPDAAALESIVSRYLRTRALVGLDELIARYPIHPAIATDLLERLADGNDVVRLPDGSDSPRWADRRNLEEVRRISLALRRRESVAITPEVFADFVVRRQHVHPATRLEGEASVALVLEQLQGFAAAIDLWELDFLPRRVRNYRPAWLDDLCAAGSWRWRADGAGRADLKVAIVSRDFAGAWPVPSEPLALTDSEQAVDQYLSTRGASFVTEIAQGTGLTPSRVRASLESLMGQGRASNDRFDPLRPGSGAMAAALSRASAAARKGERLGSARGLVSNHPEGRWCRLTSAEADPASSPAAWCAALLDRYGVLTRETALLDPWAPPWRDLAPILAQAELRGEIRRGYFVEGLSGVQYAASETGETLARLAGSIAGELAPLLLSTLDPANLYGAGAPLDIALLEGGTARLTRNAGNYLVMIVGRPVLIIEAHGKRLTGLASASECELGAAIGLLPALAGPNRRVLKVESYNGVDTLKSRAAAWLAEHGFVRDPPGMAYYARW